MSRLADLIEAKHAAIVDGFLSRARSTQAAQALDRETVLDSLGHFLRELADRIRQGAADPASWRERRSSIATEHGAQRFQIGYDLSGLIREYGTLRDVLFDVLEADGTALDLAEIRALSTVLVGAIADAATEYARARDAEVLRQAGQHIGFLAHELRNPLGSARTAFELLARKGAIPPGRHSELVLRNLDRVARQIDEALIEQTLRAGPTLRREWIRLRDFLQAIVDDCQAEAEDRAIAVRVDAPAELEISADRRLLGSAVSNLVRNAIKFSRKEGQVVVRGKEGQGRAVLEVNDQCGGLPSGQVGKLFDPFVQAGADRSGFGLGLAIAKQAVEAHKGSLRVHDLPGVGCVFVLDLPTEEALGNPSGDSAGDGEPS